MMPEMNVVSIITQTANEYLEEWLFRYTVGRLHGMIFSKFNQ